MIYRGEIKIGEKDAKDYQKILDLGEELSETLHIQEGVYESFTYEFEDGKFVDITLAIGQVNAYVDAVIFNEDGYEIGVLEPEFEILGEYIFEVGDTTYVVELK